MKDIELKVDANTACMEPNFASNRWLSIRLEMLGNLIIFFASLLCVLGVPLPLLKTIGLDSGDPTNGLPKPAVDRRSCRTFHSSKLTRGGDVDFLKQPISNSNRDDDRDENWIGNTDYSDCPDDSEALSKEAVERCRDGKVDVVDIFCKSVHNPAFRVCVKEGHGRPEVQVDDMN